MTAKVRTNNVPRNQVIWCELTEKQKADLDWRDTEELQDAFTGFIFKGQVYDLADFTVLDNENFPTKDWHGAFAQSAFHAVLVKLNEREETVIVGEYFS